MITISARSFKDLFTTQEFECRIFNQGTNDNEEHLFIHLGEDEHLRDLVCQIQIVKQTLDTERKVPVDQNKPYYLIQFILQLPFKAASKHLRDLLRLIQILNRGATLPGFELSEKDELLYYRYAFLHSGQVIDEAILNALIGTILLQVNAFGRILEEVAEGLKTTEEALALLKKYEETLSHM